MPNTGSSQQICLGIHKCIIEECSKCDVLFQAEVDKIEERSKRKGPPETWEEKAQKRQVKKNRKSVTDAVKEAKKDIKTGGLGTMHNYFRTLKK